MKATLLKILVALLFVYPMAVNALTEAEIQNALGF